MNNNKYERPSIKKLEARMPAKNSIASGIEIVDNIDGKSVNALIERYGSPLFVFSEKQIRERFLMAKSAFETRYPKVSFSWSYKTNYLNAICNIYHQMGSWAEVVSGFEYDKAINNGVPGNKIIFNGPDKSAEDLKKAIENESLIHIDHLDELYTIIRLAPSLNKKAKVAIRVNMDTGIYPMWDRFGFNYENGQAWDAINKIMHSGKMDLLGLHTHIGTFIMSENAYGIAASKLASLAIAIRNKYNHTIKYIDMGGGFASDNKLKDSFFPGRDTNPGFDAYAEAISSALLNADFTPDEIPTLVLETGRALIDKAGYLLGTVIANKRLSDGQRASILDAGVNLMFTSYWYDHKISPAQKHSEYYESTKLYGPLCMNIDVVRENVNLPLMNKGDHFVIHYMGAYNITQWMQFITLRPKAVLIDTEGNTHIIRDNESMDTINSLEKCPNHLKNNDL